MPDNLDPALAPDYIIGLDLGQANQFTALAVLERPAPSDETSKEPIYRLGRLRRAPTMTLSARSLLPAGLRKRSRAGARAPSAPAVGAC